MQLRCQISHLVIAMGDIQIINNANDVLLTLDSADGITIEGVQNEIGMCTLTLNGVTKSINKNWTMVPGTYVATPKRRAVFAGPSSRDDNEAIRRLEKVVYGLKSRDSRAASYADYYSEKLKEVRLHVWTVPLIENPKLHLPNSLSDWKILQKGPEKDVIKPCWKRLIETADLFPGHSVGYEVGVLGTKIPDIAFFPRKVSKPRAGEYEAYGDCKSQLWSGTSLSELGQGIQYGHRILDANPLRTHVYGFFTNNLIVVLIKSTRSKELPYLVHWDVTSPLTFEQGMATFFRLLHDDSGFIPLPTVRNLRVSIKRSLGSGATCRAYLAEYAGTEVVAKLYDHSDTVSENKRKLADALAVLQDSSAMDKCQIPIVQGSEGRWLLITPVGTPFTFNTIQPHHIRQLVSTLKIIHESGMVHRDVRFANIFHVRGETVVLNDWGSSVRSESMELVAGCPNRWAHPELCGTTLAIPRPKHDLYSLISSFADLIAPGLVRESQTTLLNEAFQAAENCNYDQVVESLVRHLQH